MEDTITIRIRQMTRSDVEMGMRLKDGAGWNQVALDWQAYLQLEPEGCFVAELNGTAVATTTTINYQERFGWIGMVIVDPTARRQGLATQLLNHAIAYLTSVSCGCQKLDATEAGARVYERMGFVVEYEVQRWGRPGSAGAPRGRGSASLSLLSAGHLDRLDRLDAPAFGASRVKLLQWYVGNGAPAFLAGDPHSPSGYIIGRPGSQAWQMGPLVAADPETAARLMATFLDRLPEQPIIADVAAVNTEALRLLEEFGFTRRRVLVRMCRGANARPGRPEQIFLLAGFEYG